MVSGGVGRQSQECFRAAGRLEGLSIKKHQVGMPYMVEPAWVYRKCWAKKPPMLMNRWARSRLSIHTSTHSLVHLIHCRKKTHSPCPLPPSDLSCRQILAEFEPSYR